MRILKTRYFNKWARKEQVSDTSLWGAIREIQDGLIDADLGGSVYKKRIASKGKRAGVRTILAYRSRKFAFFLLSFLKLRNPI